MNEKLTSIKQEILDGIENQATSRATAFELRKQFLDSKTGKIGQLMKEMKNIPNEEKAEFGKQVNELKNWATEVFEDLDAKMKAKELKERYEKEKIDVTIDAECEPKGNLHPITQMRNQLIDVFAGMGFTIYEGTEIENDYYNFTALNT
ncbi:MAG: phenylalanine--tRNA ligase subunit alpha, partial [Lachnospiraceae bacterium]|nr:phenylalanine--tRNA ligase subunit alpha [Lachnospiraceae bacterium]